MNKSEYRKLYLKRIKEINKKPYTFSIEKIPYRRSEQQMKISITLNIK